MVSMFFEGGRSCIRVSLKGEEGPVGLGDAGGTVSSFEDFAFCSGSEGLCRFEGGLAAAAGSWSSVRSMTSVAAVCFRRSGGETLASRELAELFGDPSSLKRVLATIVCPDG